MKIIHRLIGAYLTLVLLMSGVGYLSLSVYNEIRNHIIQLQNDPVDVVYQLDELLTTIENCQKSVQTLIENKPKIIYSYSESENDETSVSLEKLLKNNLEKIEVMLTPLAKSTSYNQQVVKGNSIQTKNDNLEDWLELRRKHFYYHWKYLSHFISLADGVPNQAFDFFERTLEPHYRQNIFPIINKYRKGEQEAREAKLKKFIEEYIPNASRVIIFSTVISLCGVFFLGFWISRSITNPLHSLTSAAQQIGRGNLGTRINIKSKDEIGILVDAFDRMRMDLSKTTVSKTYVDNIITSMLDTLIVIDSQANITKVNRSTLTLLEYNREELIGKSIHRVIADGTTKSKSMIDELLSKGSVVNVEKTYVTKNGSEIPVLFSGAVMYGDAENIQGIVCVARDIIDRKKSELALQMAYDEMERRVEKRTVDLVEANLHLKNEIEERVRTEAALRESENRLRRISSHILSAQEKERQRLSMELHDDLGQSLSLLKVQLSGIERKFGHDQSRWVGAFIETRQYLDFIIENVRRLSRDLSPSILEDLGLTAALKWLIGDFTKHHQLTPHLQIENVDNCFSKENQMIIYRIFQEIFANIGKHAQAGSLEVNTAKSEAYVKFVVKDDGKGFDMANVATIPTPEKGIGIAAMNERALMLGSNLKIWSRLGSGTRISIRIPIAGERMDQ